MKSDKNLFNIGTSSFFILMVFIAMASLVYLGIWSYQPSNNSIRGAIIFAIFFALVISSIVLSQFKIFNEGTWVVNCNNFTLGFGFWILIGTFFGTKSVLSLSANDLFASISGELPQLLEFMTNSFIIPIAEELFWMVTIPYAIISIMNITASSKLFGVKLDFLKNKLIQIIVLIIISGLTFAYFHVGKMFLAFIIAAFVFRAIQITAVFGDKFFDSIKFLQMTTAFNLGAHIGNNFVNYGIGKGVSILNANFMPVGILIYILFAVIFLTSVDSFFDFVRGKVED